MQSIKCQHCDGEFIPKPKGYNARYCSHKCKEKYRSKNQVRVYNSSNRKRAYSKIKTVPELYALHLNSNRKSARVPREWLANYKSARGCIDCGFNKHFSALQMDHEGEKKAYISDLRSSVARLTLEIENGKCVVRCANCHSIRTWVIKNGLDYETVKIEFGICSN